MDKTPKYTYEQYLNAIANSRMKKNQEIEMYFLNNLDMLRLAYEIHLNEKGVDEETKKQLLESREMNTKPVDPWKKLKVLHPEPQEKKKWPWSKKK